MFKLSTLQFKEFEKIYIDEIKALRDTGRRLASANEIFMIKSDIFWDKYKDDIDYKKVLYLIINFFKGNIYTTPEHCGPIESDHEESCDILERLAYKGFLTCDGQRSDLNEQRSYLEFILPIKRNNIDMIIKLLILLHKKGLNVSAALYNNEFIIRKIVLFKSNDKNIYKLNANNFPKLPFELIEVTKEYTSCPLNIPGSGIDDFMNFTNLKYPSNYVFRVMIFNQEWDLKQCDEILLECILDLEIKNYKFDDCKCTCYPGYPSYMKCHHCEHYKYKIAHPEYKCAKDCNVCNFA